MARASRPVLLLDSASLYYRSFYALPESMTAPDGRPHNAVRGFLSTVTRLVDDQAPAGIVACWDDDWRPEWRVDLVPSYKAHRVADGDGRDGGSAEAEPESLGPQAAAIAALLGRPRHRALGGRRVRGRRRHRQRRRPSRPADRRRDG